LKEIATIPRERKSQQKEIGQESYAKKHYYDDDDDDDDDVGSVLL